MRNDVSKPALKSVTVNAGLIDIANGVVGLASVLFGVPISVMAPIVSIISGVLVVRGRVKANKRIKGIL